MVELILATVILVGLAVYPEGDWDPLTDFCPSFDQSTDKTKEPSNAISDDPSV